MSGRSKSIGIFVIILILLVPFTAYGLNSRSNSSRIIKGRVYIDGIWVGGMEAQQARKLIQEHMKDFSKKKVLFNFQNKTWEFRYADLGIESDLDGAIKKAEDLGKKGSLIQKIKERWEIATDEKNIVVPITLKKQKALPVLKEIAKEIEKKERSAKYIYHGQEAEVIPHENGRKLEYDMTLDQLLSAVENEGNLPPDRLSLELTVTETYPNVTSDQLVNKNFTTVAGAYTTHFDSGKVNRANNIATAVKYLDGTVVPPGDIFSFNETVGPRTREAGFEEAIIIAGQEFVPGLGGGVCQVSTTLYNAALKAGMKITERSRHSRMIHYVPIGLDAAVSYGVIDLKFQNTSTDYIVVCGEVYYGTVNIKILSESQSSYDIKIEPIIEDTVEPKTETKNDSSIEEGQEIIEMTGAKGYVTRVERYWLDKGKVLKREIISRDFYPAETRIIIRGTQKTPVSKPPEEGNSSVDLGDDDKAPANTPLP